MTDKLAEEILDNLELDGDWQVGDIYYKHEVIRAMQAYHEAMMRDELFAFNKWMCHKQYDGEIPLISKCIDEYLNQ